MRILHVVDELDPSLGGPPIVAVRLATAQGALGHDIRLMSYTSDGAEGAAAELLASVPGGEAITRYTAAQSSLAGKLAIRSIRHTSEEALEAVDFVHLHGMWLPIFPITARNARRRSIPYAVAPHGMLSQWAFEQKTMKKTLALALTQKRMLSRASFLHFLNDEERRRAEHVGIQTRTETIPNGVFINEFDSLPPSGTFKRSHPEIGDNPYVLYLGRLHPLKGLDLLVDAFSLLRNELPSLRLVIAGPDAGAAKAIRDQIGLLGLADRVHVVGPQYDQDKYAVLADAMCLCLTSRHEAFSVAVVEALACRLPVVISEQCFFPEVDEFGAGEIVTLDPRRIAAALLRMASDADLRNKMGRNGRNLVEQRYTWPQVARTTVSSYQRVSNSTTE